MNYPYCGRHRFFIPKAYIFTYYHSKINTFTILPYHHTFPSKFFYQFICIINSSIKNTFPFLIVRTSNDMLPLFFLIYFCNDPLPQG